MTAWFFSEIQEGLSQLIRDKLSRIPMSSACITQGNGVFRMSLVATVGNEKALDVGNIACVVCHNHVT